MRTDKELYKYFLSLINKDNNHVVTPEKFNRLINVAVINWVKKLLPVNEFDQKLTDDLSILFTLSSPIGPKEGAVNIFDLPEGYLYGNRASFKLKYINSPCFADGDSDLLPASYIKTDKVSSIMSSFYLRPTDKRLYYRYIGVSVYLMTGLQSLLSESFGTEMILEYYKYPDIIEYTKGNEKGLQFGSKQNQEIAERAAQEYLEKNRDPRYQTFAQEQIIKK